MSVSGSVYGQAKTSPRIDCTVEYHNNQPNPILLAVGYKNSNLHRKCFYRLVAASSENL